MKGLGSNVGIRILPKSRYTTGLNPLGLGVMYSLEFSYKPYKQPEMHLVYGGITSQVSPQARIQEHKSGGIKAQKLIEKDGISHQFTSGAKNEKKITYIALGAAFNDGLDESSFNSQVATIINVVSLFDLGALEKLYINEYGLQQPNYAKIDSVHDMFYKQGTRLENSGKGSYYGLNEAGGGEGALEKQPIQPDILEWLFAAYYFIIEKDAFIKKSRERAASYYYDETDIFSVKIKKLIKAKSGEQGSKIPYIKEDDIDDFVKHFSINEETNNRISKDKQKPLLLGTDVFINNNLMLTIEKKLQEKEFDDRAPRTFVTREIRNIVINKNIKLEDKQKLIIGINFEKDKKSSEQILNNKQIQTISKQAISDAIDEVEKLGQNYMGKVKQQGFDMFFSIINDIFNKKFQKNYKPSARIIDALNSKRYKETQKAREIWLKGIIANIIKNIKAGLIDEAQNILDKQLESDQDLVNNVLRELGLESTAQRKITIRLNKNVYGEEAKTDVRNFLQEDRGSKRTP
jgi:hypothetical protein